MKFFIIIVLTSLFFIIPVHAVYHLDWIQEFDCEITDFELLGKLP